MQNKHSEIEDCSKLTLMRILFFDPVTRIEIGSSITPIELERYVNKMGEVDDDSLINVILDVVKACFEGSGRKLLELRGQGLVVFLFETRFIGERLNGMTGIIGIRWSIEPGIKYIKGSKARIVINECNVYRRDFGFNLTRKIEDCMNYYM